MVYSKSSLFMTGGERAKGQKLFLSPSQLLSLSYREEELKEAVIVEKCVLMLPTQKQVLK